MEQIKSFTDLQKHYERYISILKSKEEQIAHLPGTFIVLIVNKIKEINKAKKDLRRFKEENASLASSFSRLTSFNSDLLAPFLQQFLTMTEDEKYSIVYAKNRLIYQNPLPTDFLGETFPVKGFACLPDQHIITTSSNAEKLIAKDDVLEQNSYLGLCKDGKFISLFANSAYSLLNEMSLSYPFSKHPNLQVVANDLIDIKLRNPDISDSERLEHTLRKVR